MANAGASDGLHQGGFDLVSGAGRHWIATATQTAEPSVEKMGGNQQEAAKRSDPRGVVSCMDEVKLTAGSMRISQEFGQITEILLRGN